MAEAEDLLFFDYTHYSPLIRNKVYRNRAPIKQFNSTSGNNRNNSQVSLKIWSINASGLNSPYEQLDLLLRAEKEGVDILVVQETYFRDTYTIPIGKWLLISSGVLTNSENNTEIPIDKIKTGVAIYLNPKAKCAVTNYFTVSDRIMSATLLTKCGTLAIINHHAPDNTQKLTTKTAHWDLLSNTIRKLPKEAIKIVIGDTNIRWHGRYNGEEDIIGPYIFGKGLDYLEEHNTENRDLGSAFLRSHELIYLNSQFCITPRKTATFRDSHCRRGSFGDKYPTTETHTVLDQLFGDKRARASCLDIQAGIVY